MLLQQKWKPSTTSHVSLERRVDERWAVMYDGRTVGFRDTATTINALTILLAEPATMEIVQFLLAAPVHQREKMKKDVEELLQFLLFSQGEKI